MHPGKSGPDVEFWRGKRVLVTGHTGFKGGWLCLWLQRFGAQVAGYSLPAYAAPNLFQSARVADDLDMSVEADIRDLARVQRVFTDHSPEIVFHLAAQALVRPSYADPAETYATNVQGTVNLLEAVRSNTGVRVVVVVTSDKCYQNNDWWWGYRESDPLGGSDPYSSSKACVELLCNAYRQSFFQGNANGRGHAAALATARAGNVIGGGDWGQDRLVPDLIRAFGSGRQAQIRNPSYVRPWQHVLEPLLGYLRLAESLWRSPADYATSWNFGPDEQSQWSVAQVVERVAQLWGPEAQWQHDRQSHLREQRILRLDSSRARHQLGWRPRLGIDEALQWTVDWYREHSAGGDVRGMTESQLVQYEEIGTASRAAASDRSAVT